MGYMGKYEAEQLLGLSGTYTKRELSAAYRAKVKEYHPDMVKNRGGDIKSAEETMIRINDANKTLKELLYFEDKIECSSAPEFRATPTSNVRRNVRQDYSAGSTAQRSYTYQKHNQGVPDSTMGYNPDGSWNMNPPWRYETGEEWENYDPEYGNDGPYGGWGMNHPWGKAYFQGCQKEAFANAKQRQWAEAAREHDRKMAEERERGPELDPLERFRYQEGPMPDDLKASYEKVEHFPFRIIFFLICFIYFHVYFGLQYAGDMHLASFEFFVLAVLAFILGTVNIFTGLLTNPIKRAWLKRLDRKLYRWRKENSS